jgi:KDO2-lipid IV(A) lauroyltransferase
MPPPVSSSGLSATFEAMPGKAAGALTRGALRGFRFLSRQATANFCAAAMRGIGRLRSENRTGRDNLAAAFPEKSAEEIDRILRGVWDNLGRVVGEFVHIDRFKVYDPALPGPFDIVCGADTYARFRALRDKPALLFGAHLANWELAALAFHRFGLDSVILYRRPNVAAVADAVADIRGGSMGTLVAADNRAVMAFSRALRAGRTVAMLIDQYFDRGVDITFFGRRTRGNPLVARLARQYEVPMYGVYIVRLPGDKFRIELTEAITPARDAEGKIDVASTVQILNSEIERWVRANPEQWLWLHRRWRPNKAHWAAEDDA